MERVMMRAGISVFIVLIGLSVMVHGQVDLNRKRPEEQPKEFPAAPRKTATPQVAPPPSTPVEGAAAVSFPVVKAIVFIRSYDVDFKKAPAATNGIIIPPELTLIEHPKVRTMLAPYLGQSLDPAKISAMENSLWEFCRDVRKNPLVAIAVPPPTAAARDLGIVQVVFVDGKISDLSIRNEGHVWFSTNFIRNHIRQATNQSFNQRVFDLDLEALNSNPFLGLGYTLKPGLVPATTDLEVEVKDRFPVRPYVGFEDTGTELLGRNRFLAGGNWGNAFGWGHQLNYQYMADIEFRHLSAHSASYILPLPWRHRLEFSGSYVTAKATPLGFTVNSKSYVGLARYVVPLPGGARFHHEVGLGVEYKFLNSDLIYQSSGNIPNLVETVAADAFVNYSGSWDDSWGRTTWGLDGYFSPGDLFTHNDDATFGSMRPNAESRYEYFAARLGRATQLPYKFSWLLQADGLYSPKRLIQSEQFTIGGAGTVRGFDERTFAGDSGFVARNELRSPPIGLGKFNSAPSQLQFLGFFDFGRFYIKDPIAQESYNGSIASCGGGLRLTLGKNLTLRADYGIQVLGKTAFDIPRPDLRSGHSRAHIGAVLSY